MRKTFKDEDIEQILAEADELLQQINPEIIKDIEEKRRAQLEEHAQRLKNSSPKFRKRSEKKENRRAYLTLKECTRRWMIL